MNKQAIEIINLKIKYFSDRNESTLKELSDLLLDNDCDILE